MPAQPPPEVIRVSTLQVACDGSGEVSPELGHPRVFLRIGEEIRRQAKPLTDGPADAAECG